MRLNPRNMKEKPLTCKYNKSQSGFCDSVIWLKKIVQEKYDTLLNITL